MHDLTHSEILPRTFYLQDAETIAQQLLGKLLVRRLENEILIGKIVETEAYLSTGDPAAHSYRGMTRRTQVLFGPPGFSYIYSIHRYHCLNVVVEQENSPGCVLVRAVEPIADIELMRRYRQIQDVRQLTNGPGKLCQAFALSKQLNACDVTHLDSVLTIRESGEKVEKKIVRTTRIGISRAREMPLRFYLENNPFVSKQ